MMEKLPTYSLNKKKGNTAADFLKCVLSNFAIVNIIDEAVDLGIDMRAQLIDGNSPTSLFLNIQCKGKDEVDRRSESLGHFIVPIKITTLNYWRQQNDVTILFVVDNLNRKCYWCNPIKQVENKISEIQNQENVMIKVSLTQSIDLSSKECPKSIIQDIVFYMENQLGHINDKMEEIKDALLIGGTLGIKTSIDLLKKIAKAADKTKETYGTICEMLLNNIKMQFSEAYNYALELETLDALIVKNWCKDGVFNDTGFTRSKKSLRDLQTQVDNLIRSYESEKNNIDLLDQLQECDYEVEDLVKNIGAFLYEMAREDDPFGDYRELYEKIYEREWRYD